VATAAKCTSVGRVQVAARKIKTKTEAYEAVANKFGKTSQAVQEWRKDAATTLGSARVREALELSRRLGELAGTIKRQVAAGTADDQYRDYLMHLEATYSKNSLERLAKSFKALPRKKQRLWG